MPIGGGTFTVQNKILPGAYINFVSLGSVVKMGTRGVAALPLELNWGPENKVFSVYAEDFNKNALSVFGYSWLDGADSDNILPPDSFLGRAGMDGEGDTVHIHDVAVVVTNQENSGITVEVGNGSFVTTAQMVA